VTCKRCRIPLKKFENFVTLPVPMPQTFDLEFVFIPYDINARRFKYILKDLSADER